MAGLNLTLAIAVSYIIVSCLILKILAFDGLQQTLQQASKGCINKQQFKDLVRVFYKCIKVGVFDVRGMGRMDGQ